MKWSDVTRSDRIIARGILSIVILLFSVFLFLHYGRQRGANVTSFQTTTSVPSTSRQGTSASMTQSGSTQAALEQQQLELKRKEMELKERERLLEEQRGGERQKTQLESQQPVIQVEKQEQSTSTSHLPDWAQKKVERLNAEHAQEMVRQRLLEEQQQQAEQERQQAVQARINREEQERREAAERQRRQWEAYQEYQRREQERLG